MPFTFDLLLAYCVPATGRSGVPRDLTIPGNVVLPAWKYGGMRRGTGLLDSFLYETTRVLRHFALQQ
jgi:hypothetical protein